MARSSIADLVDDFSRRGEETAFLFQRDYRTVRWSYADVARVARQFSAELESRGVRREDRVILFGPNSAEWVAAFLGCALHGAVAVPLDRGSAPEFVRKILEQTSPVLAICAAESARLFGPTPFITFDELPTVIAKNASQISSNSPQRDDILEIIFTSGTTAEPKGVVITHANVLANLEPLEREIATYARYEKLFHPLRFLNLLPLSHVFGQFLAVFVPQALGATVVFHESLNPTEILTTIKQQKVNVCIAVPHMLSSLRSQIEREHQKRGELDVLNSRLRHSEQQHFLRRWLTFRGIHSRLGWRFWAFISGGSALDEANERFWNSLGYAVIQGYGLTETTSLVSVNHPFKASKRSIGKMLPGREVKLGHDGEIYVRGANVATRYWQARESHSVATDDGWFPTGDLGALDAEGNLYFKGRKKNVIVTPAGMNIHPEDLEAALRRQPGVRDAVVVNLPIGANAEPFAVLRMEGGASTADAVEKANQTLSEYQRVRHYMEWPENDFPRTPTGKPMVGVIEQFVRSRGDQRERFGVDEVLAKLRNASGIAPNSEINLSSMEKVELMAALENQYQVDLSEVEFSAANTVGDLDKIIRNKEAHAVEHVYPRWPRLRPFRAIRAIAYWTLAWPATLLLAKPKIVGRENLRDVEAPLLIISNHVTMADIAFVLAALPAGMRTRVAPAMQGEMLAAMCSPAASLPWWSRAIERLDYLLITALFMVFPLPQRSSLLKSFAFAGENVDAGYSVLIFPEGRRTHDGSLSPFQTGAGLLASRLRIPVLPIRIDGLFEAARDSHFFAWPNRIVVRVGKPVRYSDSESPVSITHDLERRIREL